MLRLQIVANFGERAFRADVEAMKADTIQRLERDIMQIDLPCRGKVRPLCFDGREVGVQVANGCASWPVGPQS